jgi:hypothetical protein
VTTHEHPPEGDCQPTCQAWSKGVLELNALLRRYDAMLAACRAAARIESVVVDPSTPGTVLPESLMGEELVRLNLVVGRDCPEVLLDEWGLRATLTFRGRRHECALPWPAVKAGLLTAPPRPRTRRFGVVDGGAASTPTPIPSPGVQEPAPAEASGASPASTPTPVPTPASPRPRPVLGVIPGGKSDRKD